MSAKTNYVFIEGTGTHSNLVWRLLNLQAIAKWRHSATVLVPQHLYSTFSIRKCKQRIHTLIWNVFHIFYTTQYQKSFPYPSNICTFNYAHCTAVARIRVRVKIQSSILTSEEYNKPPVNAVFSVGWWIGLRKTSFWNSREFTWNST